MMRNFLIANALLLLPAAAWGQKERADIRQGNRAYYESKYPEAEVGYKRALEKNVTSYEANFNLAGALYKQGRYDDAAATYGKLAQDGTDLQRQTATYYNLGNTYVKQRKLDEAIEAYKNALRLMPEDKEAKFNLAYAKKLKQEEEKKKNQDNQDNPQQNQNQDSNGGGGGGGQNQNQNQDRNKDNNDPDKNRDNDDRNKDRNQDKENRDGQQPKQQPSASREESERLLRAIQASEDNTKKKVDAEKAQAVGVRGGKQW